MTIRKANFALGLLASVLTLPLAARAQVTDLSRDPKNNFNNGYSLPAADSREIKGTPFLLSYWSPAMMQLAAGGAPISANLKYDVYRQELRVKRPQGDSVVVPLNKVKDFSLTGSGATRRFVCYPAAALPPEAGGGCAEVLADGSHAQLLKFVRKEVVKQAGESSSYASASTVSVLETQTSYYLRWATDGHFTPLRLKRASLEQALTGQPAALAALKTRKGNLSSEADLAAAVTTIDPLLTGTSR
jgi:hypothetical protein